MMLVAPRRCKKRSRGAPSRFLSSQRQPAGPSQAQFLVPSSSLGSSSSSSTKKSRMFNTALFLICFLHTSTTNNKNMAHALDGFARPAWNLPHVTSQKAKIEQRHPFLHQCESFAALLEHLRGGGDDSWRGYGAGDNDDYYGASSSPPRGYDDYEDYSPAPPSTRSSSSAFFNIHRIVKYGDRKIGLALLSAGLAITALGFTFLFNRTLLRLGNLLFMAGVPLTIGPARTLGYFAKPEKLRATACLALGIVLVFVGHPILGIIAEVFGLLNIFGNMFPILMVFLKQVPVLGPMLKQTGGGSSSTKKKKTKQSDDVDDYYNDYYNDDDGGRQDGDDYYYGQQQQQGQNYYRDEENYGEPYRDDNQEGYY